MRRSPAERARSLGAHVVCVLLVCLCIPATAAAADRSETVSPATPAGWDGATATGANVNYSAQTGNPCGKTVDTYCDTTLLHVTGENWSAQGGGVQVSITDYSPNPGSDFDLYIYRSNAAGDRGSFVASVGDAPSIEETTTIPQASGYYLIQVVYFAVTASKYTGSAEFVTRSKLPPDVDNPPGLQDVLASNPSLGFRSRSEPHIAQSPINSNILVAASKQYNRDRDSLAEYEFKVGSYVSFDGGRSWTDLGQVNVCPPDEAPPESWPNNTCYPDEDPVREGTGGEDADDPRAKGDFGEEYITSDPWVHFDDEGNAYLMVLDSPPFQSGNGWGMSFHRWESVSAHDLLPGGTTWSDRIPINAYATGEEQELFLDDKNTFAVSTAGPNRDGTTGIMVACWGQNLPAIIKQQTVCERSTDGGRTWPQAPTPVSEIEQLVIGVHVVADTRDPNTFYAVWLQYATELAGAPETLQFVKSTDGGQTWTAPTVATTLRAVPRTYPGQSFRNLSLPIMAVGPNSEIYITYPEYLAAGAGDADGLQSDIRIIKSTNGGVTWSAPSTVNQDDGDADQFQQYVAVTSSGQVNVSYFDRRHDPDNFFIDSFLARSNNGGATFTDTRVSHDLWDPAINPPVSSSGHFIGDYQGLVVDQCYAIPFSNDTHLANSASRDPGHDPGLARNGFQQVFSWRVPNSSAYGGTGAGCPRRVFGKETAGTSFSAMSVNTKRASRYFQLGRATITKLSAYLDGKGPGSGSQLVRGVLYRDSGGEPGSVVSRTLQTTVPSGASASWVDLRFPFALKLDPGYYWLALHTGAAHAVARFSWDPVANSRRYNIDNYADGPASPFGSAFSDQQRIAIYAIGTFGW